MIALCRAMRQYIAEVRGTSRSRFTCIVDFSYQHYALGDALTTQVNAACLAQEHRCASIDLLLLLNPDRPAAPLQGFITAGNYPAHLDALFPAFLCLPQLGAIRLMREPTTAALAVSSLIASRSPSWPSALDHLRQQMKYPLDHEIINRTYRKYGRVPQLSAPRGYAEWAREFVASQWPEQFIVCINPRQSRLATIPTTTYRDSPLGEWHAFIDTVGERYPNVQFVMLGGFHEWDRALARRRNVSIPRAMGLTLAHELAILRAAHLFMGTSSGFATMATFTDIPYLITNVEPLFAAFAHIAVDAPRFPFAAKNQSLLWHAEDSKILLSHFETVYGMRHEVRAA